MKTILHLYRLLVRSKLDYGCVVYHSASNTTKRILDPVTNECLRIATGAFKTTPIESLQVLCNEMSLENRRQHLTLKYYYKIRSQLHNPAFNAVVTTSDRLLFRNKGLQPTLSIRVQDLLDKINIPTVNICPFSYTLLNIQKPSWLIKPPTFNVELKKYTKATTADYIKRQAFQQEIS